MKISSAFLRVFFVILSIFFMTAFMATLPSGSLGLNIFIGIGVGLLFSALLLSMETLFKRYHLKAFNTAILGLFVGALMGRALVVLFHGLLDLSHLQMALQPQTVELVQVALYLLGTYLGATLTLHFSHEILISIPFLKLSSSSTKKNDLLIDTSALSDSRILDLASTGLVDHTLVIPRFLMKQLLMEAESGDENIASRAKRSLDTVRKLEALSELGLRFEETLTPQAHEPFAQLISLARTVDANILTADMTQAKIPSVEGIKIINLNSLSNALKPLMEAGESLKIKIQRFGKEHNQGVGYLEDSTMVVVNGGGDYIGECIDVQVLSVKHTSSGRMIFCNTLDEEAPAKGNRVEV